MRLRFAPDLERCIRLKEHPTLHLPVVHPFSQIKLRGLETDADLSLEQFVVAVCNETVNRVRKAELTIILSLNISVREIALMPVRVYIILAEILANTIEFSFYERSSGSISISVSDLPRRSFRVRVSDDGWGPDMQPGPLADWAYRLRTLGRLAIIGASPDGTGMTITMTVNDNPFGETARSIADIDADLLLHRPYLLALLPKIIISPGVPCQTGLSSNIC